MLHSVGNCIQNLAIPCAGKESEKNMRVYGVAAAQPLGHAQLVGPHGL